jgi:WD40 repeat protein
MLLSATDEGELTVWNVLNSRPLHRVQIYSEDPCLMCCCFEPSEGSLLASGGMEGKLHLFKLVRKSGVLTMSEHPVISIQSHDNYLSRCQFLTSIQILTASGDPEIKLWPVEARPEPLRVFSAHSEDVLGLAVSSSNPSVFVSGSCDGRCFVWDARATQPVVWSHWWRAGHVNCTKFMQESENTFMAGNSVLGVKVFDMRSAKELSFFSRNVQVTDVEFSKSGRAAFVADSNGKVKIWDLMDDRLAIQVLSCDTEAISSLALSPSGETLATSCLNRGISIFQSRRAGD